MTITRDPGVPAEVAQLMSAFSRVADGSEAITVLNASINMLSASIGFIAKSEGLTLEEAEAYTNRISKLVLVQENWNRRAAATDVEVKP